MTFQAPPHFRDVTTQLPDGTYQVDEAWHNWFLNLASLLTKGRTQTVPLAKITGGGSDGSLTITNGVITSVIPPT